MWRKINSFVLSIPFYLSNFIVVLLAIDAYKNKSMSDLTTLGISLLGIIGVLSGLSYAASTTARKDAEDSKVFWLAGDRFLHSFIQIIFGFLFTGVSISINQNGLWGWTNKIASLTVSILFALLAIFNILWAARSSLVGFHMIRKVLNERFPFRDERLFDDLSKERLIEKPPTQHGTTDI